MVNYQIPVNAATFFEIQKLAKLNGATAGETVANLLKYFKESKPDEHNAETPLALSLVVPGAIQLWRSARGEMLPVGLKLRARYLGVVHEAVVTSGGIEFNGNKYDSPSSAAVAVKEAAGKSAAAASTNGWDFWEAFEAQTGQWKSIKEMKV